MSIGIKLTPSDTASPLGSSYFWDAPQLPDPSLYPAMPDGENNIRPLTFIAQFNCAELAPFDKKKELPQQGFLWLFAAIDYYLGYDSEISHGLGQWDDGIYVLYADVPADSLVRFNPFGEDGTVKPHMATFCSAPLRDDGHRLLGKPFEQDIDSYFPKGWQMLFQLDSDENEYFNLRFYDMGLLYFMIETSSLKQLDFSNIKAYMTSL